MPKLRATTPATLLLFDHCSCADTRLIEMQLAQNVLWYHNLPEQRAEEEKLPNSQ